MTRIKICGITRIEDALAAAEAGVDALGLVFYSPSPRAVTIMQAKKICDCLPPFITTVGLFVNASIKEVSEITDRLPLNLLQFHGEEPPEYCQQFNKPWIKALRIQSSTDVSREINRYHEAQGILLDSYVAGIHGGTGSVFDWTLIPQDTQKPIILAGGLTIENVGQAINICRPYAVDVSGGVESNKGIKDHNKIRNFINNVKSVL